MTDPPDAGPSLPHERRPGTIQAVAVAARFLTILSNAEGPLALRDLSRRAGTGSSTTHRYMQSLVKEGLAAQDPGSGHYDLGPAALSIGLAALRRIDPVEIAARHMKDLGSRVALSGGVAIWTERGPTLVRWYRGPYFSISSLGLGDILPLDNTACGLMFQAFLPDSCIAKARSVQPDPFRGEAPSDDVLAVIRATCWSERTGHLLPGVTGQAAPVFDAQQELACVMTTVTNLGQVTTGKDRTALLDVARQVNRETGGHAAFERSETGRR